MTGKTRREIQTARLHSIESVLDLAIAGTKPLKFKAVGKSTESIMFKNLDWTIYYGYEKEDYYRPQAKN